MSGNRTRGVCVTGRNVTNYTNTDLFLFQNLKHWIRPLMFEFQRVRCCNRDNDSSFDHTMVDTPHPIRTAKLSTIGPNQYCGGGPRGNLGCRIFFFLNNFFFSEQDIARADSTHHSIKPQWIYRIPSELRSQALLGPISTAVGDHAGILGVECCFFFSRKKIKGCVQFFSSNFSNHTHFPPLQNAPPIGLKKKKENKPANRG